MNAQVDVLGWVDAATCPMAEAGCDGDGYPTYPRGDKEQCQWCYERKHVSAAVAAMIAEREALREEVERLQADGVHSCSPHCQRIACVLRRERDALRDELLGMTELAMFLQHRAALTTGESA